MKSTLSNSVFPAMFSLTLIKTLSSAFSTLYLIYCIFIYFNKNKFKYQLVNASPKNNAKNVPVTKNGPKGTSEDNFFLPATISPVPIMAPMKKAENKATKISGQPKNKPIKKASFISPTPIHLPRETKTIARKNKAAPKAEYIVFSISYFV